MSSTNEEYFLGWKDHGKNFSLAFVDLLQGDKLVDVQLVAEGHLISAHRLVLAAVSPYFCNMFSEMPANQQAFVFLKDISKKTVTDLITFIYCGKVNVKQDSLNEFLGAAQALNIKGLADGSSLHSFESQPIDLTPARATFNGSTYRTPLFNHPSSSAIDQYQSVQRSVQSTSYQQPMNGYQHEQNEMNGDFGYDDGSCSDNNYSMNEYGDDSFGQWNIESGSNEIMAAAPKRYRTQNDSSQYDIIADIQIGVKGAETLVYANNKFNKNGKPNGRGQQRWICTRVKSKNCRAMASTMDVNGVMMMKFLTAEHTHSD